MLEDMDDKQILSGIELGILDRGFIRVLEHQGNDEQIAKRLGMVTQRRLNIPAMVASLMVPYDQPAFQLSGLRLQVRLPMALLPYFLSAGHFTLIELMSTSQVYEPDGDRLGGVSAEVPEVYGNLCASVQEVTAQAIAYGVKHKVDDFVNGLHRSVAAYVDAQVQTTLHDLMRFLQRHLEDAESPEMREVADVLARVMQAWVPHTLEAFMVHRYHSTAFSVKEQELLAPFMAAMLEAHKRGAVDCPEGFSLVEWKDFLAKVESIAGLAS